jgi:hypothetical protein
MLLSLTAAVALAACSSGDGDDPGDAGRHDHHGAEPGR